MGEADELLKKARELLDKGDLKKAFSTFDKVIKLDSENADAHFGKAEAAVGIPKYSLIDVAMFYREAIKRDPENGYYYLTYGDFCLTNGLLKQAVENYEKAVELDPDNKVFYYNDLAYGYYKYGILFLDRQLDMEHEDVVKSSIEYFLKAFNLNEKDALNILNEISDKGIREVIEPVRKKEKEEQEKLKGIKEKSDYEKLIASEPTNPYNHLTFGQFCFSQGLLNLGESNFLQAIKIDPSNRFTYYNDLSPSYFTCGVENYGNDLKPAITKNSLRYALHSIELSPKQALQHISK
jgi:tetratricopeptide (TPR) repeat protein